MSIRVVILSLVILAGSCQNATNQVEKIWTEEDRSVILDGLNSTTEALLTEINDLTQEQWDFREDSTRWSIGEIVEHLELQNQLHFREINVTSKAPEQPKFRSVTDGQDSYFSSYGTDTTRGQAQWFLEPLGRFRTPEIGMEAFLRARSALTEFVEDCTIDLRLKFTFRKDVEGLDPSQIQVGEVRDLHQLLLTGIAHTERHLRQIQIIKNHPDFP